MRAKAALFDQFAAAGKGLAHPSRLELLDLLAQGECPVEPLAAAAGLKLSTASAHLQTLKASGLVSTRRDRTRILYRLAGPEVGELLDLLRRVAASNLDGVTPARDRFLGLGAPDDPACQEIHRDVLLERVAAGRAVVLDVRPEREYSAGHIPGAVSIPLDELAERLAELPNMEIVAYCRGEYCVLSYDAVRLLTARGRRAVRLVDGMLEWRLADLPVESSAESRSSNTAPSAHRTPTQRGRDDEPGQYAGT